MRLQASLGDFKQTERTDMDNHGKLMVARVIKTNNRDQTVDVICMDGSSINKHEGNAVTCQRLVTSGGFNEKTGSSYGTTSPLRVGDYVVIGYVDSNKHRPVVLGCINGFDHTLSNRPEIQAMGEFDYESDESFNVNGMQDYQYENCLGFEKVHHTGAFFVGKKDKMSDHRENGFKYKDLTIKDKWKYETIRLKESDMDFKPYNYLIVTKNKYDEDDEDTVFNRFYHDAEKGVTRVSKDGKNSLTYVEIDNGVSIVHQKNSNRRKKTAKEEDTYPHKTLRLSNEEFVKEKEVEPPEFQKIQSFSRFSIDGDGNVSLTYQNGSKATKLTIGDGGIDIQSNNSINLTSSTSINIVAPRVNISEHSVNVDIAEEDKENEWQQQWITKAKENGTEL